LVFLGTACLSPPGLWAQNEADAATHSDAPAGKEPDEEELPDLAPDALRDPIIGKFIKRRILIDKPGFSMETGGRIQVQYFDADADDPDNEDDIFLRRVRPFFLGHIGKNWTWKFEGELSADIQARDIDLNELDIRDMFLRYEGFKAPGARLTIGNQKAPFSRDFLAPNTHLLLIERTATGQTNAGVPGRVLGVHYRGATQQQMLVYWANLGILGHRPDAERLRFDTLIFGKDDLNEGLILTGRLDLQPVGPVSFSDSDPHTPELRYAWSLAGYAWRNDDSNNTYTSGGVALDSERADIDAVDGFELSGGLRGRGITLDWQYNRFQSETVVPDFTGGIYEDGETNGDSASIEGGYWVPRTGLEFGGAFNRLDFDTYAEPWDTATLVLSLHGWKWFDGKLQITHSWLLSRFGIPDEDFQETRVQIQYVW
jgi:hypothetical protein